jgi:hypothetical protein
LSNASRDLAHHVGFSEDPSEARCTIETPWGNKLCTLEDLLSLAVTAASERSVERVLVNIVKGFASQPGIAPART